LIGDVVVSPDRVKIGIRQLPTDVKILNREPFLVVTHERDFEAASGPFVLFFETEVVTTAEVFILSLQIPRLNRW
jgi:hypothetical protein